MRNYFDVCKSRGGFFLMTAGILLLVMSGILLGYNSRQDEEAGREADTILQKLKEEMETPDSQGDDDVQGIYSGVLSIPVLGLELPVLDELSYEGLRAAPCRYYGEAETGRLVIAAHNYSSHFGRLSSLSKGAAVRFTDAGGRIYDYQVTEIQILDPYAVEDMIFHASELTLFTCTYGGGHRVTVRCAKNNPAENREMFSAGLFFEAMFRCRGKVWLLCFPETGWAKRRSDF